MGDIFILGALILYSWFWRSLILLCGVFAALSVVVLVLVVEVFLSVMLWGYYG